jgi:16S rRNA (cytidine1402-2'-O)-methyltransferase
VVDSVSNGPGTLFVVATPIGNLDDITRRAVEVLRAVDGILAEDTRHSRTLLRHIGVDRPLSSLHQFNEQDISARLVQRLVAGDSLALISDAGTPLISDPGFPLVSACRARGIAVVPVPGPSALTAALSVAGLPTDRFRFEGFPPRKPAARLARFASLAAETATLVFYESAHRIVASLEAMAAEFGGARDAVVLRELTKLHETALAGPLAQLAARVADNPDQRRGEFVVAVAGAAPAQDGAGDQEVERVLRILLAELPVRQAAALAAQITGRPRNAVYRLALAMGDG